MGNQLNCCVKAEDAQMLDTIPDRKTSKKRELNSGSDSEISVNNNKQIAAQTTTTAAEEEEEEEEKEFVPNDDFSNFQWPLEDSDEEIEEMAKLKTQWEIDEGVRFSKRGLIAFIEQKHAQENPLNKAEPATAKAWERKLKNPGLTYYLKKGGTKLRPKQPFFRSEFQFNRKCQMQKIIKCIYYPEEYLKWDKNLISASFSPAESKPDQRIYGYTYQQQKKQLTVESRDFYEKGFIFESQGKIYRYSCAIADSEKLIPVPEKATRAETIYNFGIMSRNEKHKVCFDVLTQADFKLEVPAILLSTFLPKATKSWYDTVQKHYNKNHKNL